MPDVETGRRRWKGFQMRSLENWTIRSRLLFWMSRFGRKRDSIPCSFCAKSFPSERNEGVLGWGGAICKSCIASVIKLRASSDPIWRDQQLKVLEGIKREGAIRSK